MSVRSATPASAATAESSLAMGTLSPVSADSAVFSDTDSITRASAAMVMPSSTSRTSPGTTASAGTVTRSPSRRTSAVAADIRCRLATAFSARASCA